MSEKPWAWPDTPAARQNLETLSALARAIGMAAPGRFVLLLAKCNVPIQREALAAQLRAMLEPLGVELQEVALDEPVSNLLSHLQARLGASIQRAGPAEWELLVQPQPAVAVAEPRAPYSACPPLALSVYGLETSLRSDTPHPPLLAHLNLARERYRELGCPLVLWLPDYALTRLAREAPDFWAWRSGVFEFAPQREMAESALRQMAYEPDLVTSSLDAAAKRERLALLEQLLTDWRKLGEGPREQYAQAHILGRMGRLYQDLGEYEMALEGYEESAALSEGLGDRAGLATTYNNIGEVHRARGEYGAALEWYEKSVALKEALGNQAGLAPTYNNIGLIHKARGEYGAALEWYEKSVGLFEALGDRAGLAPTYSNIASVHQARGEYGAALEWYEKSVALGEALGDRAGLATTYNNIASVHKARGEYGAALEWYEKSVALGEALGDRAGLATTLHNMGYIAQDQGDYAEARRLYQKSLDIKQQLGDRAGVATTLHQLGRLAQDQGDYAEAHRLYQESLDIAQQLGSRDGIARTLHQLGTLVEEDGDLGEAERLFAESLASLEALSSPDAAAARRSLDRVRERLAEESH